ELSVPEKFSCVKTVGNPSIEEGSVLSVNRQVDPLIQIVEIGIYLQPVFKRGNVPGTLVYLFPQGGLNPGAERLAAEREQDSQGGKDDQSHQNGIQEGQLCFQRPVFHGSILRTYPAPRTVWISFGSRPSSSFFRR